MLNREASEILTAELKQTIADYLGARPASLDVLREVLVALAATTGAFLCGCPDDDAELRSFFDLILMQEIEDRSGDGLDIPEFLRREAPAPLPAVSL